jgi:uncharacterized protein YndB with AHSA1/START domain
MIETERFLNHPPERVWSAMTEAEQLSQWYPFEVLSIDLRIGGRISFDDGEGAIYQGEVTKLEPGRVFSFTEGGTLVHIEIETEGDGCRMFFRHTFDDPSIAESNAIGWEECLDDLESLLREG